MNRTEMKQFILERFEMFADGQISLEELKSAVIDVMNGFMDELAMDVRKIQAGLEQL